VEQPGVDVREKGANQQTSERRLFMQLQVWTGCPDGKPLVGAMERSRIEGVLYHDVNDPAGVPLTFHRTRLFERRPRLSPSVRLPGIARVTMLGAPRPDRADLEDWLLARPRRTVLNPAWPWGIWYPLRRGGAFARLSAQEQGAILREHGTMGRAYGDADLAHDVRLACHGLDTHDNDFVIGLVGRELHPLSHLVQAMRRTAQTSQYLQSLGPFFIGHALWQSPLR
jgi:chlorite dismutase